MGPCKEIVLDPKRLSRQTADVNIYHLSLAEHMRGILETDFTHSEYITGL